MTINSENYFTTAGPNCMLKNINCYTLTKNKYIDIIILYNMLGKFIFIGMKTGIFNKKEEEDEEKNKSSVK